MNRYRNSIAREIRAIRDARGETQGKFAEVFNQTAPKKLNTTRLAICKYENGVILPPADKYLKFKSLLPSTEEL